MEVLYNSLFFGNEHLSRFVIDDFTKYMLTSDISVKNTEPIKPEVQINTIKEFIKPKQNDSLFWCFYICLYGYGEYIQIQRNYGMKELEVKQEASVYVSQHYDEIKNTNYKVTKVLFQEIISDLNTNLNDTTFHALLALITFAKINIFILHNDKPCYLSFITNSEAPTYLIKKHEYNKYSVKLEPFTKSEQKEFENKYYGLESYNRPIKAISNFKVNELLQLAGSLELNNVFDLKKQELYNLIVSTISWY